MVDCEVFVDVVFQILADICYGLMVAVLYRLL